MGTIKFSVITSSLGKLTDRYCRTGYKEDVDFGEKLLRLSKLNYLSGVEFSPRQVEGLGIPQVKGLLEKYGFANPAVDVDLTSEPKYKFGSITAKNPEIREQAVNKIKAAIDFASELGTGTVNVWLGQEGFDYPLQTDYVKQWGHAVESLRECADYNKNMKLSLEPKPREPRNKSLIDTVETALLLASDIGRDNVGLCVDVGHILQYGRNMTQAVANAFLHGKLFHIHTNDNYASWDDDMIIGSVHTVEFIELFALLKNIGYDGWCSVDIFPFREDSFRAAEESILYMRKFEELVDVIGGDRLNACLESDDTTQTIKLIRESIFK